MYSVTVCTCGKKFVMSKPVLKVGARSPDVVEAQTRLNVHGPSSLPILNNKKGLL